MSPRILITGCAGFIGFHCAIELAKRDFDVLGIDNLNAYYDPQLKLARLAELRNVRNVNFQRVDIADGQAVVDCFATYRPDYVLHLAAQAGVRYSLQNPRAYLDSNLTGFFNILEACRNYPVKHLLFASSSSVYGASSKVPFSVHDRTDDPISFYAATKKANEVMAHSYSHVYGIPATGLRFFTVYGPWGRPDMAYFSFTKAILAGDPIDIFNHGQMERDFTYIDDIVEGIARLVLRLPAAAGDRGGRASKAPYRLYNIGNHSPVQLLKFIETLEELLGKTTTKRFLPMQVGDVPTTYADVTDLQSETDFAPNTPLSVGLARFVEWYRCFYCRNMR